MSNTLLNDYEHSVIMIHGMNIADRIFAEMDAQGIQPTEMMRRLGLPAVSNISNWRRRGSIPKEWEAAFCRELNVSIEWAKTGKGDKHQLSKVQARIAAALESRGWSVLDLVEACDGLLAAETVDSWLCGASEPTESQLRLVADRLGSSVDWFKYGLTVVQESTSGRLIYDAGGDREYPPDVQTMIDKYLSLSQDGKDAAQGNIDVLVKLDRRLNEAG